MAKKNKRKKEATTTVELILETKLSKNAKNDFEKFLLTTIDEALETFSIKGFLSVYISDQTNDKENNYVFASFYASTPHTYGIIKYSNKALQMYKKLDEKKDILRFIVFHEIAHYFVNPVTNHANAFYNALRQTPKAENNIIVTSMRNMIDDMSTDEEKLVDTIALLGIRLADAKNK